MMLKKLTERKYVRGLFLLATVFLLFLFIRPWGEKLPPLMQSPTHPVQRGEAATYPFQFAVLSDLHKGWGVFKPIMKEIARDGYSFVVIGGDIVAENKGDRYRFLFRELARIKGIPPIYFVPGNHDVYDDEENYSVENFRKFCGPDHYWFSWGNAAFVALNDARSTITADQFHWLESTLRKLRGNFAHIFVIMHVPPFDPRKGESYCLPEKIGRRFMRLMEEFEVDYVFCGHIHCYFREVINGVTYIICGGGGGGLKCSDGFYHYVRVFVGEEGIEDSVIKVKKNRWIELTGDIQYNLRVKHPFFLPFLTVVMGQSYLFF